MRQKYHRSAGGLLSAEVCDGTVLKLGQHGRGQAEQAQREPGADEQEHHGARLLLLCTGGGGARRNVAVGPGRAGLRHVMAFSAANAAR
jgi:hypothetical protein